MSTPKNRYDMASATNLAPVSSRPCRYATRIERKVYQVRYAKVANWMTPASGCTRCDSPQASMVARNTHAWLCTRSSRCST